MESDSYELNYVCKSIFMKKRLHLYLVFGKDVILLKSLKNKSPMKYNLLI